MAGGAFCLDIAVIIESVFNLDSLMRLKSFLVFISALTIGGLLLTIVGLYNEEKFYSEYWLQRKIDGIAVSRKTSTTSPSDSVIRYRFYHSAGIDFALEIGNHDNLRIARHTWLQSSKSQEVFSAKLKANTFRYFARKFSKTWHSSQQHDVDDHFGGKYAEIELVDTNNPSGKTLIGFYNRRPDSAFENFKSEMLELAEEML